jgi:hypothetical protein
MLPLALPALNVGGAPMSPKNKSSARIYAKRAKTRAENINIFSMATSCRVSSRRFDTTQHPRSVEEQEACFVVHDASG